jgi:hypothetical protein
MPVRFFLCVYVCVRVCVLEYVREMLIYQHTCTYAHHPIEFDGNISFGACVERFQVWVLPQVQNVVSFHDKNAVPSTPSRNRTSRTPRRSARRAD